MNSRPSTGTVELSSHCTTQAETADNPFEPVNITANCPPPQAGIHSDKNRHWLLRLLPIIGCYRGMFITLLIFSLFSIFFQAAVPALLGKTIDALTRATQSHDETELQLMVIMLIGAGTLLALFTYIIRCLLPKVSYHIETDLRTIIYNHLTRLSFTFYDQVQTGQLISRANSDIREIRTYLTFGPFMLIAFMSFFLSLAYMLSINITLTLMAIITMPGVLLLSLRLRKIAFPLSWLVQSRLADVATIVDENINAQKVIKAFAKEVQQVTLLHKAALGLRWAVVKMVDTRARYTPLIENIVVLSQIFVLLYGGWLVIEDVIKIGDLAAFNLYIVIMQTPFRILGFCMMLSQRAAASAKRIFDILDEIPETANEDNCHHIKKLRGHIKFHQVCFSYGHTQQYEPHSKQSKPSTNNDNTPPKQSALLKSVNFEIHAGEKVAIVGRTGSGKSTIASLLLRFYQQDQGYIFLDGIDVKRISLNSLRHNIGLVANDGFLFSCSIRENILYGRPSASHEEMLKAAKAAQADDFITALPDGYDTIIGERGYTLSGGQRQRINIARELLANPPVLILDDASSAIDAKTEEKIHTALLQLLKNRTTIIIAHRYSTISLADRVLFLHNGTIAATGTHEQLMHKEPDYKAVLEQLAIAEHNQQDEKTEESDEEYYQRIRSSIKVTETSNGDFGGNL